ncbi:hypothetical protein I316_06761 [Kwoniella heveanensis BCC8398]|uniref:MYND-type domain-containing protein n=1 Tax=Kwoniella heveanensis BCC8398 TaxID=1296120 RepID=A0A1B9GKC6_9TREE|nr:hypothetical protein I316_06761 [Kwoniella heveanensis BCC8398]
MRESNYTFPPQNRAVTNITHMIYDRRALDTNSPLALLNSLTSLTYLTSTSPRIREILTIDGGLERLLDILRDSCLPKEAHIQQDLWGLNGPPTARVITVDRANSLRHSLAFQCVVNIGVRGSEDIRTRVVQSGALDLVAQILESWLKDHGVSIFAGHLGSQAAVDAVAAGLPVPGTEHLRRRSERGEKVERSHRHYSRSQAHLQPPAQPFLDHHHHHEQQPEEQSAAARAVGFASSAASAFGFTLNIPLRGHPQPSPSPSPIPHDLQGDTDVDMADAEGGETDDASVDADDASIDVDDREEESAPPSTTPRASTSFLPMAIPPRSIPRETQSRDSSVGDSLSGEEDPALPRNTSENNIAAAAQGLRPPPLNLSSRIPQLAQDPISTQSSPMGTPTRNDSMEVARPSGRRGTIIARPNNLAPRNERRRDNTAGSGTSDGGEDIDLPTATIAAGIAAANAQAMEGNGTIVPDEPGPPPNVEIIETTAGQELDELDPEAIAAEQARLDMEAGAPPGQPGAAQTPRAAPGEAPTPRQQTGEAPPANTPDQAQIIIANGAPRGFHDLGSYVGISSLLNPDGNRYSDDSILLALQLLAYLSKYPHVRTAFHHPRRPMHPTFEFGLDTIMNPLPQRPAYSETPDIFSLVERFTFRPSPSDPLFFKVPQEIQYWAGVIMRNACRKDEARGGIRQCANMSCGRWEKYPREFAKCRRCRKAKYCSKECQSRAWQEGHRFWCSSRSDQEPGSAAAEGAGGFPSGTRAPPPAAEDDEEFQLGMQMGLSPEVVSRALAAARAAGIIPGQANQPVTATAEAARGDIPAGATAPTAPVTENAAVFATAPARGNRGVSREQTPQDDWRAGDAAHAANDPYARAHIIRGADERMLAEVARPLRGRTDTPQGQGYVNAFVAREDSRMREPLARQAGEAARIRQQQPDYQEPRAPRGPQERERRRQEAQQRYIQQREENAAARSADTWRRLQNVGALLGLRNDAGSAQTSPPPPAAAAAGTPWQTEAGGDPSRNGAGHSGGESRRGSQNGVTGLGFNLTDQHGRP